MSENDKLQLRNHIYQVLAKWKQEHSKDKLITIADLMHDEIITEEPS